MASWFATEMEPQDEDEEECLWTAPCQLCLESGIFFFSSRQESKRLATGEKSSEVKRSSFRELVDGQHADWGKQFCAMSSVKLVEQQIEQT